MVRHHPGLMSLPMSFKDLISVHCFSWYRSVIYHMTCPPILNYLQMIPLFNNDLRKISNWAYQWKMSFNPDPLKKGQEVILLRKMTKTNHPKLIFSNNPVHHVALQKHLGMFLDCKLNFEKHLKTIVYKINKTIGLLSLFTTKLTIPLPIKDWNQFNTMRH